MLNQTELRSLLNYCPDTGLFTWVSTRCGRAMAGNVAGTNSNGYIHIKIGNSIYRAHRLAWLYTHGCWPRDEIDHINGDRKDNRILNIREATKAQNNRNTGISKNNTSGYKGVSRIRGKWRARIGIEGGKQMSIGHYSTPYEAHLAYEEAAETHHKEFKRG